MNKTIAILGIVGAFVIGTLFSLDIATAVKPVTEVLVTNSDPIPVTGTLTSDPACPAENVQHWVRVSFGALVNIEHDTEPTLSGNTVMTIPLTSDDVNTDNGDDDKQRVIDKLNALGYFVVDPTPRPVESIDVGVSVGNYQYYSTICAEN